LYKGLNEPPEVTKATAKYKVDNDKFNEFFDQCIEECDDFESNKVIYNSFQNWWTSNYSTAKIPEIKELRRALKIKFGNEIEQKTNGLIQYGFKVKVKNMCVISIVDEDDL
jgi:phage/plasmid-associated DNA primase